MKCVLIFLVCSVGLTFAADLVPESGDPTASIEKRRAAAFTKRLDRFETMKGRVYEDVRITAIDDGGISLAHSSGTARLRFDDLSPQQRRYFGMDEKAAAEIYRREWLAREAYENLVEEKMIVRREVAEKAAEERRLAEEKAEAKRALAVANRKAAPEETIPIRPNIQRIDSGSRRARYSSYPGYGGYYGYYPSSYRRSSYGYRYGGTHCINHSVPGFVIRW